MNTTSRPATPDQVRLFIGLSSLMVLPMVAVVMIYGTVNQTTSDQAPAWRAFVLAVVVGAAVGLVLVSFVPLFGGTVPKLVPVTAGAAGGPRNDRIYRGWRGRSGNGLADPVAAGPERNQNAPPLAPSPARGEGDWGSGLEEAGVDRRTLDDLVTRGVIDRGEV